MCVTGVGYEPGGSFFGGAGRGTEHGTKQEGGKHNQHCERGKHGALRRCDQTTAAILLRKQNITCFLCAQERMVCS